MMTYLFPRLLRHEWYSRELCEWHYWLSAVGILVMAGFLKPVDPPPKDPQLLSWGHLFPRP